MMPPFAMLQDAALMQFLSLPGAGLQKLAVYHMVSRVRELRERGERVTNATIGRALGIPRKRVSEAMSWLYKVGLIEDDHDGPHAVKLDPVDLQQSVRCGGRSTRKASAVADGSGAKASAPADGITQKRPLERTVENAKASAVADGAPYIERSIGSGSSVGSSVVSDGGTEDLSEFEIFRGAIADLSTDPTDPWIVFRTAPVGRVRELLDSAGMFGARHDEPNGKFSVRWRVRDLDARPRMLRIVELLAPKRPVPPPSQSVPQDPKAAPAPIADAEAEALWAPARAELRRQLGDVLFRTHFGEFVATAVAGDSLTIATPDEMASILVAKNYRDLVERCAATALGRPVSITIAEAA